MPSYERISDFLMTGCAVAPAIALYAGRLEIALLSHIVLLFAGVTLAGCDAEAPFRNPSRYDKRRS
ncbi:MAG: hypothetical protein IT531_14950 [Burkholderiales bacterium]|nr:hypothetical protein [Burkholderiales bacterium]